MGFLEVMSCRWNDFRARTKQASHKGFFITLHDMCTCYGQSPSDYLFPDVECPHFRLFVDTLVYHLGRPEQVKGEWKRAALSAGAKLPNL